jgi:class 3 adenylate cyclase
LTIGKAVAKEAKESASRPEGRVDFGAAFASFVPRTLQLQITAEVEDSGLNPTFEGKGSQMNAAVLFADASGFTALTEKLARQSGSSAAGAENMCRIINVFFGMLIDVIHSYGGDIMKFEGDAMTVTFAVMPEGGPWTFAPRLATFA